MKRTDSHFLNVDLDLKSKADLAPLVAKLGRKVVVLHERKERGAYYVSLELSKQQASPEACMAAFAKLIEALPRPERRLWDAAASRRFDVGVQADGEGVVFVTPIKAATLGRIAKVGGEIVTTVYAPEKK